MTYNLGRREQQKSQKQSQATLETIAGNTGTTRFLLHPRVLPFLNNGKQFQYLPHEVLDATVDRRGMARIRRGGAVSAVERGASGT